jgi:ankyrin repeat protein
MLLAAGADANTGASRKGWKPLMAAAKSGEDAVIAMLLAAGADHEAGPVAWVGGYRI